MKASFKNLRRKHDEFQECYELLSEKIQRLRRALILETDASSCFKYEKQIEQAEADRAKIEQEIKCIETKLNMIRRGFILNPLEVLVVEFLEKNDILDELLLGQGSEKVDLLSLPQINEMIAPGEEHADQDVLEFLHLMLLSLETDSSLERRKKVENVLLATLMKHPKSVEVLNNLAALESSLGNRSAARQALEMALKYLPRIPREHRIKAELVIRSNMVKIYSEAGPYPEAISIFERKLFSSRELNGMIVEDNRLIQLGWGMEVGNTGVRGLFIPPTLVVPRRYAGYAYLYQGMVDEAIEQFRLSYDSNHKNIDSLVGLSLASSLINSDSQKNREYLDVAQQQLEDHYSENELQYHHYLSHVLIQLGKYEDALNCIEKVRQIEPQHLFFTAQEPSFYPLHADREFQKLIHPYEPIRRYPRLNEVLKQLTEGCA